MPEKDLHGFLIFGKMCKITSKKLEKCEKKQEKKFGKMCKNGFEKPEKCISINIE